MDAHHSYYPQPEHDLWGGDDLQKRQAKLDPHPWKVHGGHISWDDWCTFEDLYDGVIRQADAFLEHLVEQLRQRGAMEDTLLVITANHGEGFGEESHVRPGVRTAGHVAGLHEGLLHVPLLVSSPGQDTGKTIDELVTLTQFPLLSAPHETGRGMATSSSRTNRCWHQDRISTTSSKTRTAPESTSTTLIDSGALSRQSTSATGILSSNT